MSTQKVVLFLVILFVSTSLIAQNKSKTIDVGGFVGTNTVVGDITSPAYPNSFRPGFGGLLRYVPNNRLAYRAMAEYGYLHGSGSVEFPTTLIDNTYGFSKNFLSTSLLFEVNWKEYKVRSSRLKFTPFIGVGLGLDYYFDNGHGYNPDTGDLNDGMANGIIGNPLFVEAPDPSSGLPDTRTDIQQIPYVDQEESFLSLSIPVVFGVKYNLGSWWSMSAEVYAKKLFSDKVDNLDNPYQYFDNTGSLSDIKLSHNNDWIFGGRICIYWQVYHGCRVCPDFN